MVAEGRLCLGISNLPEDATLREVHILFSACPGYVRCQLTPCRTPGGPDAVVHFDGASRVLAAMKARLGTSWAPGLAPVDLSMLGAKPRARRQRADQDVPPHTRASKDTNVSPPTCSTRSRTNPDLDGSPRECTSDPPGSPSTTSTRSRGFMCASSIQGRSRGREYNVRCGPWSAKHDAKLAVELALKSRRRPELEEVLVAATEACLSDEDLDGIRRAVAISERRTAIRDGTSESTRQGIAMEKVSAAIRRFQECAAMATGALDMQTGPAQVQRVEDCLATLRRAIDGARFAGVGVEKLAVAQAFLVGEERRSLAEERLRAVLCSVEALMGADGAAAAAIPALRWATQDATDAGACAHLLHRAARLLAVVGMSVAASERPADAAHGQGSADAPGRVAAALA